MKYLTSKNRAILREMISADFKIRYQGSVLGYFWTLLKPLFMFLVLYVVFSVVFKVGEGIPNYPIYLFLGIVLWSFFSEITQTGLGSVVDRGDLIQKIKIPRWIIILSTSASALINLGLNLIVVCIFALISGMDFMLSSILLPFYIVEIYVFALGLALLLSALYVKYRDIKYVWDVVLQAGFYATPILYPLTLVTSIYLQKLMLISPIAQSIQGARNVFVTKDTITIGDVFQSQFAFLIPFSIVLITLLIGIWYFRKESKYFAENL